MQCIVAIGFDKTNREYVYMYLCIYVCGPSKRIVSISYIFSLCYDPPLETMAISPICKILPWSFQSTQVKENLEVLLILINLSERRLQPYTQSLSCCSAKMAKRINS